MRKLDLLINNPFHKTLM